MEARLRIVAWILAVATAGASGYAVGVATDGDEAVLAPPPAHRADQGPAPSQSPDPGTGAEDEYELAPSLPDR
jgi:hypothetical protein